MLSVTDVDHGRNHLQRCHAAEYVKNDIVRGLQRYRCGICGDNVTMTLPKSKPPEMKALALLLYAMGNMSFGAIARILRVSDVTMLTWVRGAAHRLPEPSMAAGTVIITFYEMWHFLKKDPENLDLAGVFGF